MATKAQKSAFGEWFKAQFGKRRKEFPKEDDEILRSRAYFGQLAQQELDRRERYDAKEAAALSAYCAFSLPRVRD